ncbi:MAG: oligosaccharide repeat unit polymerase, partial [Pseudomonadota bacterium]
MIILSCAVVLILLIVRRHALLNPLTYFTLVVFVQMAGSFILFDSYHEYDRVHAAIFFCSLAGILAGAVLFMANGTVLRAQESWTKSPIVPMTRLQKRRVIALLVFSIGMTVLYYQIVGYNLFFVALRGGADVDFTTLRLEAYSGSRYTAPGLFNQFKNTILPVCTLAVIFHFVLIKRYKVAVAIGVVLLPFVLFALLGTGQRAFLFYFVCITGMMFLLLGRIPVAPLAIVLGGFLFLFNLYSVLLGRAEVAGGDGIFAQLSYRLFAAQQTHGVNGFAYVYQLPYQYGGDWVANFRGLVPGIKGSTLSHELHAYLFGSTRGTVPVSLWVSAYHNFGYVGAFLIGFAWVGLLRLLLSIAMRLERNPLNMALTAAAIFYFAITPIGHPAQVFNYGLFGLIF